MNLKKYVNEALCNRLRKEGKISSSKYMELKNNNFNLDKLDNYEQYSRELLGNCYFNTKELSNVLKNNNISYSIYKGGLTEDYNSETKPESFEEAKKIGLVHYWIEANGYVCEISSESKQRGRYGQPVVLPSRPDNYIVFNDSIVHSLD